MFAIITRPTVCSEGGFNDAFITTNESQLHRNRLYAFYTFVIRPPIINGFLHVQIVPRPIFLHTAIQKHCELRMKRTIHKILVNTTIEGYIIFFSLSHFNQTVRSN